jgi:hypothetical protein
MDSTMPREPTRLTAIRVDLGAALVFEALTLVSTQAVAGTVARPPRTRPHRILEASLVAGCLALAAAIAFHDALWQPFGSGALTFPALATLTLGACLATWLVTAALLTALMPRRAATAS